MFIIKIEGQSCWGILLELHMMTRLGKSPLPLIRFKEYSMGKKRQGRPRQNWLHYAKNIKYLTRNLGCLLTLNPNWKTDGSIMQL